METLWFCLVAFLIAGYVILDGFDIGAGIVHLFVARSETERRQVFASIGPVWDGNEVWLLAAGGTLYCAFPGLYASSFSGFYLPLMIVLWLLILRGCSIEFRNHIRNRVWLPFWDAVFAGASALLAVFFGTALGNVVRGVPLDKEGDFFLPLWTSFLPEGDVGVLDWYTVLIGAGAAVALTMHGALWVSAKTNGELQSRARRCANGSAIAAIAFTLVMTAASFAVQPRIWANFSRHSWGYVFPALALAGLVTVRQFVTQQGREWTAFVGSAGYLAGMLAGAAFGLYPAVLPSAVSPELSLTVYNASAEGYGLRIGLAWWIPGMLLAIAYTFFLYRRFSGKVAGDPAEGQPPTH